MYNDPHAAIDVSSYLIPFRFKSKSTFALKTGNPIIKTIKRKMAKKAATACDPSQHVKEASADKYD